MFSALVGSANFNNRGYSHDSESAGVWVDRVASLPESASFLPKEASNHTPWHVVGSTLARKLRAKLWNKHLNVRTPHLFDGLGASRFWHDVAEQTTPERLSGADLRPSVAQVTIDGVPWSRWAPTQGPTQGASKPPEYVKVADGDGGYWKLIDGTVYSQVSRDWVIDPDAPEG